MSVTFADIKAMVAERSALPDAATGFLKNIDALQTKGVALGAAQQTLQDLAILQGKSWPSITRARVALYASAYDKNDDATTAHALQQIAVGAHPLTALSKMADVDLRVYELDLTAPRPQKGLDETTACHAISYGLMAVEEGVDLLLLGSLSAGAEQAADAIATAVTSDAQADALFILAAHGGHDLCALTGAALAARMAGIPVFAAGSIAAMLEAVVGRLTTGKEAKRWILQPASSLQLPSLLAPIMAWHQYQALVALVPATATPKLTQIAAE